MKYPAQMSHVELDDAIKQYGLTKYLSGLRLPYNVWRASVQLILRKAQLGDVEGATEDAKVLHDLALEGKDAWTTLNNSTYETQGRRGSRGPI